MLSNSPFSGIQEVKGQGLCNNGFNSDPTQIITDLFQMSIEVKQELALHLYSFRNVSMKQQGNYFVRFHIYPEKEHPSDQINFLTPTSIISNEECSPRQKSKQKLKRVGYINDAAYISPYIPIKYSEEQYIINEICLFRNSHIIDIGDDYRNMKLSLYCELLILQNFTEDQYIKCSEFQAEIKGSSITEYLEITFDGKYACTLSGMIRSIVYKAQFRSNQEIVKRHIEENKRMDHIARKSEIRVIKPIIYTLDDFVRTVEKEKAKQILDFYLAAVEDHCKSLEQQFKSFLYHIAYEHCQRVFEKSQLDSFAECLKQQREKMRIFDNSTLKNFDGLMHRAANKIYPIWASYIRLIAKTGQIIIPLLREQYRQKIEEKWGQSIVRNEIKALDWAVQKYNTGEEHLAMSKKLRRTDEQFDSDNIYVLDKSMFPAKQIKSIMFDEIYQRPLSLTHQKPIKNRKHLVIFVHGLGASRYDMQKLSIHMKREYQDIDPLLSMSNQGRTQGDINDMSERLAREVLNYVQHMSQQPSRISFVGHSMGGVIIRGALPRLYRYSTLFHTLMTLSSPHVGYLYNSSTLIDAGLWIINNVQKCKSTQQLTMTDSQKLEDSFMYKLTEQVGMEWFKEVVLVSSYQDAYIPYDSARIQKCSSAVNDSRNNVEKGRVYCTMVDNILNRIKAQKLHRVDINLEILEKNVDNFIGRAAHIKFLNSKELLSMITIACKSLFN